MPTAEAWPTARGFNRDTLFIASGAGGSTSKNANASRRGRAKKCPPSDRRGSETRSRDKSYPPIAAWWNRGVLSRLRKVTLRDFAYQGNESEKEVFGLASAPPVPLASTPSPTLLPPGKSVRRDAFPRKHA